MNMRKDDISHSDDAAYALLELNTLSINDLVKAVRDGDIFRVKFLLGEGIDINGVDNDSNAPLQIAAEYGHYEIVELLLNKGAEIDREYAVLNVRTTALQYAIKHHHNEVVRLLLERSASLCTNDGYYKHCWSCAAVNNNQEAMSMLLKIASSQELALGFQYALNAAIRHKMIESVRWLLQHGASPSDADDGSSYMCCAVGNIPMMELLLSYDSNLVKSMYYGELNLLQYAVQAHSIETVKWLTDIKKVPIDDSLNLFHCVINGLIGLTGDEYEDRVKDALDMLKFLDFKKLDWDKANDERLKPIHLGCFSEYIAILKYFLDKGYDINDQTAPQRLTLLHLAVKGMIPKTIRFLIDHGANLDIKDSDGLSPAEIIMRSKFHDLKAKVIIEGADLTRVINVLTYEETCNISHSCSLPEKVVLLGNMLGFAGNNMELYGMFAKHVMDLKRQVALKDTLRHKIQLDMCEEMANLIPKIQLNSLTQGHIEDLNDTIVKIQKRIKDPVLKNSDLQCLREDNTILSFKRKIEGEMPNANKSKKVDFETDVYEIQTIAEQIDNFDIPRSSGSYMEFEQGFIGEVNHLVDK